MKWETWSLLTMAEKEEYDFKFGKSFAWSAIGSLSDAGFFGLVIMLLLVDIGEKDTAVLMLNFLGFILALIAIFWVYAIYEKHQKTKWLKARLAIKRK